MNSAIFQDLITSFVTTIPMLYFIASVLETKKKWLFSIIGSLGATLIHYIFVFQLIKNPIVSMLFVFSFILAISIIFSKKHLGKSILAFALAAIGLYVGEIICYLVWTVIAGTNITNDIVHLPEYQMITYIVTFILIVIYIVIYYILYILWNRIINKTKVNTIKYFIIFPLSQALLIWFILDYAIDNKAITSIYATILILSLLSLIADAILFKVINSLNEKYLVEKKNLLMEQELNKGWDYYNNLISNYESVNKIRHDIRNQIMIINAMIDKKEFNKARKQVVDLEKIVSKTEKQVCDNNIISSVVEEKEKICKKDKIVFKYDVIASKQLNIKGIDLCSLFSNILDNAIKACKKIDKKEINLTTKIDKGYLIISEENYYKELSKNKKKNEFLPKHGLGLEIINDIATRYDGNVKIDISEEKFKIVVLLKLNITK